jgi:hypothetical protein
MHSKLQPPILVIDKQEAAHNYNNAFLKNSSMGLTNFLADFFWVKTLLESDIEHYKKDDLNSWMYLRFKSIAHLDPWFYTNYIYGAIYLSVIKDDIKGASEFIQEGLKYYPEDKTLNQFCLFHFTSEEPNPAVADKCLKAILNNPQVPDFFKMMEYSRENGVIPNNTCHGLDVSDEHAKRTSELCGAVAVSVYDKDKSYDSIKKFTDTSLKQKIYIKKINK